MSDRTTNDDAAIELIFMTSSLGSLQWDPNCICPSSSQHFGLRLALTQEPNACCGPNANVVCLNSCSSYLQQHTRESRGRRRRNGRRTATARSRLETVGKLWLGRSSCGPLAARTYLATLSEHPI